MLLTPRNLRRNAVRRAGFTLLEVLVVVAIIVILAGIAVVAVPRYIEDGHKTAAMAGCKNISNACEAYQNNPANPGNIPPNSLEDLVTPPFGGPSYLRNGQADMLDPWGQRYNMQPQPRQDGTSFMWITTQSPRDGTPISQFGIGQQNYMSKY